MNDINDLRRALEAETADLSAQFPVNLIRHRAHRLRLRQRVTMAAVAVVAVAAGAVPATTLVAGSVQPPDDAGQMPWMALCLPEVPDDSEGDLVPLGPLVETGATLDAPAQHTQYDVLIGLVGTRDRPGFVVAFRDRGTGTVHVWDTSGLVRAPGGDIAGKRAGDPAHQFLSRQLAVGENRVLDVGLYTRTAHRIAVASEGEAEDAEMTRNTDTGWTLFWVQRSATPLPADRFSTPGLYEGPERVTLTAYDPDGRPQHAATGVHVGGSVQNPRDGWPTEDATPSPTLPPSCPPPASTTP